jgi:hydrophobe/amphiphile efflux-3 (HAE3) family protein
MKSPALVIASLVHRYPVAIIAVALAAAAALAFGIPRLEFKTGQETLIDPSSEVARDNTRFQREFGGDPMLVLFEAEDGRRITELFATGNRAELERFARDLAATGHYHSVITPLTVVEFASQTIARRMVEEPRRLERDIAAAVAAARAEAAAAGESPAAQEATAAAAAQRVRDAFQERFGADAQRFLAVGEQSLDNPRFVEFVLFGADGSLRPELSGIFPDERHALMVVRLQGNLSIDEGSEVAAGLVERAPDYRFDGVAPLVSGPPLLIKEINDEMRQAIVVMAVFAVAIMVAVLFLIFRARWRLLSLPAVLIGCVAAFGLMGFVGIPLTMVTISGLPILIGLGVDFAIQAHSRIEEETFGSGSAEAGVERATAALGPALGIAVVAACIGFLVLHLSDVPMIRDFGSMLAVGAMIVFLTSIALISGVVYLRERKRLGPTPEVRARIELERFVGGLTSRTAGRLLPIAAVAALIAVSGLYVGRRIETQTDPERFVPSDSRVLRDLHYVRDVTGSTSELNLLVDLPQGKSAADQDVLDWMYVFMRRQLEAHAELKHGNSLATFVAQVTGAPPTAEDTAAVLGQAPPALADQVVNADGTQASITFAISGDQTLAERKELTQAIEDDASPPGGVTVSPAGIAVVGTASVDALSANRDLMSFAALGAILLVLLAVFRSPVRALTPLLPVVLALGASSMILYIAGITYSPLTSISGPLIIAMATEFNILLMFRYFEERAQGLDAQAAMSKASLRIGRAITASGLTVMGGFAVLAFSGFPLLDNFGKVTALNIGISLISTLVLLPPLLVWADGERPAALPAAPEPQS